MTLLGQEEPFVRIASSEGHSPYSVSPDVNSKTYHDAFETLPVPKPVAESAYREAGRILRKANGTDREYLVAINARTGERIVDNLDIEPSEIGRTGLSLEQREAIEMVPDGVVLLHNHPASTRPSLQDVSTASSERSVRGSIILAHDSDLWYVSVDDPKIAELICALYNETSNEVGDRAKIVALNKLLDLNERHRLFVWKKAR